MEDFAQSAAWNPAAEEIDYNWGKAAYSAHDYRQAARSLGTPSYTSNETSSTATVLP
jgi:hypothetical protein